MVTIVDPLGTPTPYYNLSGTTVQTLVVTDSTVTLSNVSGWNVVLFSFSGSQGPNAVIPSGANVGDVFELCYSDGSNGAIFVTPSGGETINNHSSTLTFSGRVLAKKLATSAWIVSYSTT